MIIQGILLNESFADGSNVPCVSGGCLLLLLSTWIESSNKLLSSFHRDHEDLKDGQIGQVNVLEDDGSTQCHRQGGICGLTS